MKFLFTTLLFIQITFCQSKYIVKNDLDTVFNNFNVKGSFLIYDLNNDDYILIDSARCLQQFIPASTFKIFNSLVGFETGLISDSNFIFKWDGNKRNIESWNHDLKLRLAFQYSCVPCYQSLAKKIGQKRMQYYVDKENYGNRNIGGGIDQFWLTGDLRISQFEQIKLLKDLYNDKLSFSKRNMEMVKHIMISERNPEYILHSKTGWGIINGINYGWLVGYIEKQNNVYFFALNIESENPGNNFAENRFLITKEFFRTLNIIN